MGLTPSALRELSVPTDPDNCHERRQDPKQVKARQRALPIPKMLQTNLETISAEQVGNMGVMFAQDPLKDLALC